MAFQNLITNKISAGVEKPLTNGQWQNATGLEVEDFVSRCLADTITHFEFDKASSELRGYNLENDLKSVTTVVNSTPVYVPELTIEHIRINSNNNDLKTGGNIELNKPSIRKVEVGIKFKVPYEILGKYYYAISPQSVIIALGSITQTVDRVVPNSQSNLDAIQYIDVTNLFTDNTSNIDIFNDSLQVSCTISDQTATAAYNGTVTIKDLKVLYNNKGYIEGNTVSFEIKGLRPSESSNYKFVYFDNKVSGEKDLDYYNKIDLSELEPGVHQIYSRIEHKTNSQLFYSEWIQTNVIVDYKNIEGGAVAVINSVPTTINNCSNALLYKICYAAGESGGQIVINSYLSDTWDDFSDLAHTTMTPFNSTTLNLTREDGAGEKEFYSFFELETVGNLDARYIGFTINGEEVYSYSGWGANTNSYFTVEIVENPYNINNAFNHVPGAILDYSQINGSGSNVFLPENIQLQPGDGWGIDSRYTAFQVSASNLNLFKNPLDLTSYLNNGFTFEFLVRTYNVNGDDPVLRIGNLMIGPGYVRLYHDPDPEKGYPLDSVYVNSKADFQKDKITHILVTYSKEYRPSTYMDTYNHLISTDTANYQTSTDIQSYNVLKIFINGVINREIQITDAQLKDNGSFKFQINPISSDLKVYGLRTYNYPFKYEEIKKNYISSMLDVIDKKSFYDKNDILDNLGRISLRKCFNKYNVIVYVIPTEDRPLFYGNKGREGNEESSATLLVHYADPTLASYNGRLWGGSYKAQGSSAKKYLIHNCQYNIKNGNFLNEEAIANNSGKSETDEGYVQPTNYYTLPGSDIKIKKLVGKVNYASSMQTHKQGACNTYDDVYKNVFSNSLDKVFPINGRKACMENEFLYFYYNITPEQSLDTITIQDTLDNARFLGFQTWGSAKADDATYGYDKKITPEYLLVEGADNVNPGANFKVPWAAFQTYDSTLSNLDKINQQLGKDTKKSYTVGLLIDDETIKYGKIDDPWDIDYGATEYEEHYKEDINPVFEFKSAVLNNSLPYFVKFYNAMYQYDFTSFISTGDLGISGTFDVADDYESKSKKIYVSAKTLSVTNSKNSKDTSLTTLSQWDVLRWCSVRNKWVPAGLHFGDIAESDNGTWEPFNLAKVYDDYSTKDEICTKYWNTKIDTTKFLYTHTKDATWFTQFMLPAMRNLFECACEEYLDVNDVAFHQAMIRVLSGTDNRAKNTYFQIIGRIYEKDPETGEMIPIDSDDAYKIRLMQDDMDTIFATDNNGQQNKEYYLLEPAFNKNTEKRWGDTHSSLFYPFDLCFADKINQYTGNIIQYLLDDKEIEDVESNLYKNFLRIQKYFPAIAYNHTAEIYYELAQTLYQNGKPLFQNGDFKHLLNEYVNNSVKDPLSLSHGSNYEGEVQFLQDRLLLLGTLTGQASGLQTNSQSWVDSGTNESGKTFTVKGRAKYISYLYPNYFTASNYSLILNNANPNNTSPDKITYESLLDNISVFPQSEYDTTIVGSLSIPDKMYDISMTGPTLTGYALSNSDKYKYLEITEGLEYVVNLLTLPSAAYVVIDGDKTNYRITTPEIEVYKHLPVIEELVLTNITFGNTILDFRNCNRLRKLDLSGCSKITSIILPEGGSLSEVTLPSCIKALSIINNPRLSSINFESGTKLVNLNVNLDGVHASFDINDLIRKYFDTLNAEMLKLTGDAELDLDVVTSISTLGNKASLFGTYKIYDENGKPVDISYQLKKSLAKSFGNIDSDTSPVKFDYASTTLRNAIYEEAIYGCEYVAGADNEYYPFENITFKYGNDLEINNDGTLHIVYYLDNKAPASINPNSGLVTVKDNSSNGFEYRVTVYSKTAKDINITGTIYFGYIEPQPGDYAYADGTFSKSTISSKTIVGLVYAKRVNPLDSTKLDLAILGAKTVSGICGPDYNFYSNNVFNENYTGGKNQYKVFSTLIKLFYPSQNQDLIPPLTDIGTYNNKQYSPYTVVDSKQLPSDTITRSTEIGYPTRSGKQNTYFYKTIANEHLKTFAQEDYYDFRTYMVSNGFMTAAGEMANITSSQFDDICDKFDERLGAFAISGTSYGSLSDSSYAQLLYPVFYKACLFEPELKAGEQMLDGYKAGNWYVPSIEETRILVANRIRSTTSASTDEQSKQDWDSTTYTGNGIFTENNKGVFSGFLTDLGFKDARNVSYACMTSDVVGSTQGFSILYGETNDWLQNTYQKWFGQWSFSSASNTSSHSTTEHKNCRRDMLYTLPLCCEITVTKKS